MECVRKLPEAEELRERFALTEEEKRKREELISEIKSVLDGTCRKKLLIIGPCSADREDAVLEYMVRLKKLKDEVSDTLLIIPRIYTSKPRTNGRGYKGLLHRPDPLGGVDNLSEGIVATRKMHIEVIHETGMFGADEMLYPEATYYISDLLSYAAVGARSVENQQHRLVASGMDVPVGMKNPISGDVDVMLNAILAAQSRQSLFYHGWECHTDGNPYAHAILRGYADVGGRTHSNYHYENITDIYDQYLKMNLKNISVLVDCNHSNSRKHYDEQMRIGREVIGECRESEVMNSFIKGLMVESYLVDGNQLAGEGVYGKSITDPCLGWEKTEKFVHELDEMLKK